MASEKMRRGGQGGNLRSFLRGLLVPFFSFIISFVDAPHKLPTRKALFQRHR